MIPTSLSEFDALRNDECLQLLEQLGEAQQNAQVHAGGQGTTTPDTNVRAAFEGTADQNQTEDIKKLATPKGSDYLGFGKHGAKTHQRLYVDHEFCLWVDNVEHHQSHWKLERFSSWLKMQSVCQEPSLVNSVTQERMTRRIKQLEEEKKLFAEMQASKELKL